LLVAFLARHSSESWNPALQAQEQRLDPSFRWDDEQKATS
jgi:hypothetical protein